MSTLIDEALRAKGVETLYTWAENDEQYRYNQFMGFVPTGEQLQFDFDYPYDVFEFKKDLS